MFYFFLKKVCACAVIGIRFLARGRIGCGIHVDGRMDGSADIKLSMYAPYR